jgi:hypothetical protein
VLRRLSMDSNSGMGEASDATRVSCDGFSSRRTLVTPAGRTTTSVVASAIGHALKESSSPSSPLLPPPRLAADASALGRTERNVTLARADDDGGAGTVTEYSTPVDNEEWRRRRRGEPELWFGSGSSLVNKDASIHIRRIAPGVGAGDAAGDAVRPGVPSNRCDHSDGDATDQSPVVLPRRRRRWSWHGESRRKDRSPSEDHGDPSVGSTYVTDTAVRDGAVVAGTDGETKLS